ncbi:short-chain oxidoreductase [Rhexocercosporidium sp. MPI-PUGE-AT-0058]|nr:short-chain oxidoreductase [Rhexocercosporidium sp. MPI-PUGE-AT-0058]
MAPLVWLITGTSSGIGLALAQAVLARGDHVIATARDITSPTLLPLQTHGAHLLAFDVTLPQSTITSLLATALTLSPSKGIDILVNNAGYLEIGVLEDLNDSQWRAQFETNVFGAVRLAKAILPSMRERGSGTVVWVGSVAGWKGEEGGGAYCGSKFAVAGIAESFREEVVHLAMTAYNGRQPCSPLKAAKHMIEVITSTGMAKGRDMPERLVLGSDALEVVREKCERTLALLKEWEEVGRSTDF